MVMVMIVANPAMNNELPNAVHTDGNAVTLKPGRLCSATMLSLAVLKFGLNRNRKLSVCRLGPRTTA